MNVLKLGNLSKLSFNDMMRCVSHKQYVWKDEYLHMTYYDLFVESLASNVNVDNSIVSVECANADYLYKKHYMSTEYKTNVLISDNSACEIINISKRLGKITYSAIPNNSLITISSDFSKNNWYCVRGGDNMACVQVFSKE